MKTMEVKVKKWGSSLGFVLPKDFVKEAKIEENDTLLINVFKEAKLDHLFGKYKGRGISGQEAKDMLRKEW